MTGLVFPGVTAFSGSDRSSWRGEEFSCLEKMTGEQFEKSISLIQPAAWHFISTGCQ